MANVLQTSWYLHTYTEHTQSIIMQEDTEDNNFVIIFLNVRYNFIHFKVALCATKDKWYVKNLK